MTAAVHNQYLPPIPMQDLRKNRAEAPSYFESVKQGAAYAVSGVGRTLAAGVTALGSIVGYGTVVSHPEKTREVVQEDSDEKMAKLVGEVLGEKEKLVEKALNDKWNRYNPILIGGDLFTMGYLGFEGALSLAPGAASIAGISLATLICGEIAGAINILEGIVSLKEAVQAFRNKDKLLGWRLLLDFVCLSAIGVVMILVSTSLKVAALGAIGLFFTANPWVLPVLYLIIAIPVFVEICKRLHSQYAKKDMASQLKMDDLQTNIVKKQFNLPELFKVCTSSGHDLKDPGRQLSNRDLKEKLVERMEEFQADMGVQAALEAFRTWKHLLEKKQVESLASLQKLKTQVDEWNQAQKVRLFQQILMMMGFGLSMGMFVPGAGVGTNTGDVLDAANNLSMAAANGIPLYTDIAWPFKRNTPIVVPAVEVPK